MKLLNIVGARPQFIKVGSILKMLLLEKSAIMIHMNLGGVQKEAFLVGVLCVTFREETEWVETAETSWNLLVSCDLESIVQAALGSPSTSAILTTETAG